MPSVAADVADMPPLAEVADSLFLRDISSEEVSLVAEKSVIAESFDITDSIEVLRLAFPESSEASDLVSESSESLVVVWLLWLWLW